MTDETSITDGGVWDTCPIEKMWNVVKVCKYEQFLGNCNLLCENE